MTLETWICSLCTFLIMKQTTIYLPEANKKKKQKQKRKTVTVKPSSNSLFANKP